MPANSPPECALLLALLLAPPLAASAQELRYLQVKPAEPATVPAGKVTLEV